MEELQPQDLEELLQELEEESGTEKSPLQEVEDLPQGLQSASNPLAREAAAKPVASPAHFRLETEASTLRISWRPDLRQRIENAIVPLLLVALSILLLTGGSPDACAFLFGVVAFGSGYWVLAVLVNATRVIAGQEEWTVQRGPLPLPQRQFYLPPRRVDPAACRWVWTERVEEYKLKLRGSSASGGSSDGALGCLLALLEIGLLLSSIKRELVVSYKLHARCVDGGDKELLQMSSKREAEYLEYTLQNQLDAGGGLLAQE